MEKVHIIIAVVVIMHSSYLRWPYYRTVEKKMQQVLRKKPINLIGIIGLSVLKRKM